MGLFSTLAPIATIGAGAMLGPAGAMGVGALSNALAANERNQELEAKARQSRNAAADAIGVSWGRKDGRGYIPGIFDFNESQSGNMMAGALGGAMGGLSAQQSFANNPNFSFFGSETPKAATPDQLDWLKMSPARAKMVP